MIASRQAADRPANHPAQGRPPKGPTTQPPSKAAKQPASLPASQPIIQPPTQRIHQCNSGPLPSASFLSHILHTLRRKPSEGDWAADMPGVPCATGEGAGRRQPASQARRRHAVTTMRPRNACSAEPACQLASHSASQRGSQAAIQGPSKPSNLTASQLPDEAAKRQHRKPAIRTPPLSSPSEQRLPLSSLALCLLFRQRRKPETQARDASQNGIAEGGGAIRHAVGKEANPPAESHQGNSGLSLSAPSSRPLLLCRERWRRSGIHRRWPRVREGGKASARPASPARKQSHKAAARQPRRASG